MAVASPEHPKNNTSLEPRFVFSDTPVMLHLERTVEWIAATGIPVLIVGECGSGKRTLAAHIHRLSGCQDNQFKEIDCSEAGPDFLPSEPNGNSPYRLATLLLTEISSLNSAQQGALLAYEINSSKREWRPRIIATTEKDLREQVRVGAFREDLFYAVSRIALSIPPLRYRSADIPILAEHFLRIAAASIGRRMPSLSSGFLHAISHFPWTQNVRELQEVMNVVAHFDEAAALKMLGIDEASVGPACQERELISLKEAARFASRQAERELILKALSKTRWNRRRAAEELQISYKALLYKLKQIELRDIN